MSALVKAENTLKSLQEVGLKTFLAATSRSELYEYKVKFLGKNGQLTEIMKEMAALSKEEKPQFGKLVNEVKTALEKTYSECEERLKAKELGQKLAQEYIDLTLPSTERVYGRQHPVSLVIGEFFQIMARLGYSIQESQWIESDHYNFEALNIPKDHPARDMQDTFFVSEHEVLRTHTSPVWSHALEKQKPPLRIVGAGAVFRCDSDISHLPHFHQFEAVCVDRKTSMAELKGTISFVVREFFGPGLKTRFRPSFFPFTEPSAEVDCTCPICKGSGCSMCKHSGWIEIGGCGLINPKVFEIARLQYPDWQGFAFGFGIERMAIIKYGISDIRLFPENDLRFLNQFMG